MTRQAGAFSPASHIIELCNAGTDPYRRFPASYGRQPPHGAQHSSLSGQRFVPIRDLITNATLCAMEAKVLSG